MKETTKNNIVRYAISAAFVTTFLIVTLLICIGLDWLTDKTGWPVSPSVCIICFVYLVWRLGKAITESEEENEKIRKEIIDYIKTGTYHKDWITWLKKQGEQPTQEIEPFEAEHGKYYYCIKDYFCGGRKQASKGDVIQALRGLPIMGLKDASEYFLPVNFIKCNSAWSEEDNDYFDAIIAKLEVTQEDAALTDNQMKFLKSLKGRVQPQPKQEWSAEDINMIDWLIRCCEEEHKELCNDKYGHQDIVSDLKRDCRKKWDWLESLKNRVAPLITWKPSDEQIKVCKEVYADILSAKGFDLGTVLSEMNRMEEQLKKLKEE